MALMTVFAVSCEPDDAVEIPTVSFAVQPVNSDDVFTLTLLTTGYNGTGPVTVPVTFSGSAEQGTDYSVSDEAFIIGGATPVTTITLTTLTTAENMSVTATLSAPDGFQLGQLSSVTMALSPVRVYASFSTNQMTAMESSTVTIQTYDSNGAMKRMDRDLTIEFEVDEERSTAVLGTNFEFASGTQSVVVGQSELDASFVINRLQYDEEHNTVVLRIKEGDNLYLGTNARIEITFAGPVYEKLSGTWVMNELVTDLEYFNGEEGVYAGWGFTFDGFPEFNAEDRITFDVENGTYVPAFQSTFSNYFKGEGNMSDNGDYLIRTGMGGAGFSVQLIQMDNINRFFSATDISDDNVALVGVRFITDDSGEELMDMYIIDHTSHSFMPELEEYMMYDTEKPVATSSGCYLNMTFKRAE